MKSDRDYYQILGIQENASPEDIRKAYRLYASKFHPDKHDGDTFFEERFKELTEAYEMLSDENKKIAYDAKRFGKGRVVRKSRFEGDDKTPTTPSRKLKFDEAHWDIYITLFYLVNLSTWIIVRRLDVNGSTGGLIWSLFLCALSSLLIWIFITKWRDARNQSDSYSHSFPVGYLLVGLLIGAIPLITNWIP